MGGRRIGVFLVGLALATATGCATSTSAGGETSTTGAVLPSAGTSAPESAAPTTRPPAVPPATTDSAGPEWEVSEAGVGPLGLGRRWRELVEDPAVALDGGLESCSTAFLTVDGYEFAIGFAGVTHGDEAAPEPTVAFVDVRAGTGDPTTPVRGRAGVTLGSPAAAVEQAYPGGTWAEPAFNPEMERIYVAVEGSVPITFGVASGVVTAISVGHRDIGYEYCG